MEERNNTTTPANAAKKCCCGWGAFVVGLVVALILGWWVLPNLMKETKRQPIAFSHVEHVQNQGMTCEQCHFVRADGTFSGTPTTAQCAECHSTILGSDPEEARFVREYVQTGREIKSEWLIYQKQPDNVFFSHVLHFGPLAELKGPKEIAAFCSRCHLNVAETDVPPVYRENRLSGYSENTMLMWGCERCHAEHMAMGNTNASNACFTCHK
ncbi:menaquinone reductase multiheme cytochrome c subunit QrcA [Mailhella massiliensis]|uniref:Cytochrome c family protein n=1 Tax=Mailhella massiliensis TaxID=1903261 RepID=A0A921DQU1_9BACT|nr:menaquinone reductase multiheme cytochrome c subunit QrcA [Mailhella massiliensis]HJD96905.1 cytochrome c family protein [Mailhella massiliensis]